MKIPTIGSMIHPNNYSPAKDPDFVFGKRLHYFNYNCSSPQDEKVVVFSDEFIPSATLPQFNKVKHKVAWLMESPKLFTQFGGLINVMAWLSQKSNQDVFSAIATCDDSLVESRPDKFVYVPFGGILVFPHQTKMYNKTNLCSLSSGTMTQERADIYEKFKCCGKIDFLGKSFNRPYKDHVEAFSSYMYHLSIPSSKVNRYFSSNLTDALACGTIPIWNGCSLDDLFDMDGIITFKTLEDLDLILHSIGEEDYNRRLEAVKHNLQLVEKYRTPENALWENILSKLYRN
jgi:hypothetical protein